jgi:hypothetical protein
MGSKIEQEQEQEQEVQEREQKQELVGVASLEPY